MKLLALSFVFVLVGCAHSAKQREAVDLGLKSIAISEPVELKLKAEPGRVERIQYKLSTYSVSREGQENRYEQSSETDFTVRSTVTPLSPGRAGVKQILETISKEGQSALSTIALPEKDELIEMHLAADGTVLRAGMYPQHSLYFVPAVSLPSGPVAIGDTWPLAVRWYNMEDGMPFVLEMVSILRGFVQCGSDVCADVDLSGDVRLDGPEQPGAAFSSHWEGRMLFARDTGTVVWMRVDSLEQFKTENAARYVQSCLENVLIEPASLKVESLGAPTCNRDQLPGSVRLP